MIIFKDVISNDEMISDIYKMKDTNNGVCIEVEGRIVSRKEGEIDDALIGGNASVDCPGEDLEGTVIRGVDIVINHKLQQTGFTKESYKKYIKGYMKSVKSYLEEHNPDRVNGFMSAVSEKIKDILANFSNYEFYTGESMNPEGMVCLLDYREDGETPYLIFFKDGLEMEKC